jgi:hydroxypyruvate isomerase
MLKFDPNLRWLFTELPMRDRYAAAARAGFRGVEVAFPYDIPAPEMAAMLEQNDLTLVQILSPVDWEAGERGIAALPDRVADFRSGLQMSVEYAAGVGRPFVHVLAGNVPKGAERQRYYDTFITNLTYAADAAAGEGLTIIIEPVCRARFPDFLFKRLDEGIEIIEATGRSNVKLCFDTYHVQMEEGAVTQHLEEAWPHIGHMQIGNAPGRNEPGVGENDLYFILDAIERRGWSAWIGLEYTPSTTTLDTLDWAARYGLKVPA